LTSFAAPGILEQGSGGFNGGIVIPSAQAKLPIGSNEFSEILSKISQLDKLYSLYIYIMAKEISNTSDSRVMAMNTMKYIDPTSGPMSFSFLYHYHHLIRNCSRQGLMRLIGGTRDYWMSGVEEDDTSQRDEKYNPPDKSKMKKRQFEFSLQMHEEHTVLTVLELLRDQLQEAKQIDTWMNHFIGGDRRTATT
jgi:hypothetical protein